MSEASGSVNTPSATSGREQRRIRNFLLDKRFQLKYAGYLAAIALVVSALLGVVLWWTSNKLIDQSRQAVVQQKALVTQGQETVKRGQLALAERKKNDELVKMNIAKAYEDSPELAKQFSKDAESDGAKLKEEQASLEKDADSLKQQAAELERQAAAVETQQRNLIVGLVLALGLLVACIWIAGIVVTHKIAGPVFKMKRMFSRVGEGHLALHERLRKGDEMQDFFESFDQMLGNLRAQKQREIAQIDEVITRMEADASSDGVATLKKLRAEMQAQVDG
ncbi:HAMP domain-containing protein [Polyangium spumosum]|uniref:HAMP domain-containing protein n=1 Tax=Polyangium spumosum TaxID=889282 RepID=A0A6N7PR23_9BACT|nr:HAMP domain-containing protein [Polyangium spumosum]MRG93266.1 HAMP domain-containing protein [Polyangium spumosum]